jgi:16S rRNA processing protein RimM
VRGSERIEIGGISRAHGIRGEVVAVLHDPTSTVLTDIDVVWVDGQRRAVERARPGAHGMLLKLAGVDDRNAAETLRGAVLEVDRGDVEIDEDEILLDDMVGCQARRADGTPWGEIVAIEVGFQQDRLVIHTAEVERQLPLVDAFVVSVDLEAGVVVVDPPEGLPETPIEHAFRVPKR